MVVVRWNSTGGESWALDKEKRKPMKALLDRERERKRETAIK